MKEEDVLKQIIKLYEIKVKSTYNYLKPNRVYFEGKLIVKVEILFVPKNITVISPVVATSYGSLRYSLNHNGDYKDIFEDMRYIRYDEMPVLQYISGMFHFDNICEKIVKDEYLKIKEKYY
jgi:hypothetical protein